MGLFKEGVAIFISKDRIYSLIQNKIVLGSAFLFAATFAGNIFNFGFNFGMARLLGPADYGDLNALASILYIVTFPSLVVSNVVTKFAATLSAKNDFNSLKHLFVQVTQKTILVGVGIVVIFGIFSTSIATSLKIDHIWSVFLVGILSVFFFLITINLGMLNGLLRFKTIAIGQFLWPLIKLVFSVAMVLLGFGVGGAMTGFTVATFFAYFITGYPLRFLFQYKEKTKLNWAEIGLYSIPAALSLLGITLLVNTDILMVKAYFPKEEAGIYAAALLLAKIISFLTLPISNIAFPMITQAYESKKDFHTLFLGALGLTALLSGGVLGFYILFPIFSSRLLFGPGYDSVVQILTLSGTFTFIYSLLYLFVTLWLSTGKLAYSLLTLVAAAAQLLGLFMYHSTLAQVISISIYSCLSLLIINVVLYIRMHTK